MAAEEARSVELLEEQRADHRGRGNACNLQRSRAEEGRGHEQQPVDERAVARREVHGDQRPEPVPAEMDSPEPRAGDHVDDRLGQRVEIVAEAVDLGLLALPEAGEVGDHEAKARGERALNVVPLGPPGEVVVEEHERRARPARDEANAHAARRHVLDRELRHVAAW
jgi:hypothetical protein